MATPDLNDTDKLLRYMDFTKFMDLVHNKWLYFPRADSFDDKFEGYYTNQIYEISKKITIESSNGKSSNQGLHEQTILVKESAYVSCWMRSLHESMAHWEIYGGKNSVAILTSVKRLKKQLDNTGNTLVKKYLTGPNFVPVDYIDHHSINDELARDLLDDPLNPLRKKNIAFQYEDEVRVIYSHYHHPLAKNSFNEKLGKGFTVDINCNDLIENIIVSPKADKWFFDLVNELCKKKNYNLTGKVKRSSLYITPFEEVFGET
jgi:hypothetical protein